MKKISLFLGVVLMATIFTSCEKEVTGISLDKSNLSLAIGEWETLTAMILPADADKSVTWTSSNPVVATVVDGIVTALTVGTTTITAKAGNYTATCEIIVDWLIGTTWDGYDTDGDKCMLQFINATDCLWYIYRESRIYDCTYSVSNYPNISVTFTIWHKTLSGSIVNNTMTLYSEDYGITLHKQ